MSRQMTSLNRGAHIVVATPGRLIDQQRALLGILGRLQFQRLSQPAGTRRAKARRQDKREQFKNIGALRMRRPASLPAEMANRPRPVAENVRLAGGQTPGLGARQLLHLAVGRKTQGALGVGQQHGKVGNGRHGAIVARFAGMFGTASGWRE